MRLQLGRTIAATAFIVLTGAANAEVTVSQSNDPSIGMGEQLSSLFGVEHSVVNAMPEAQLQAVAVGTVTKSESDKAPAAPSLLEYSDAWLASLPSPDGDAQWDCMRKALYFEARGESIEGQFAVAEVVLNRVDSPGYPKTICGVVHSKGRNACAFSWVCDGNSDTMRDPEARDRAGRIARVMIDGAPRALTGGATFFHARYVRPNWGRVVQTAAIGQHLFYRSGTREN